MTLLSERLYRIALKLEPERFCGGRDKALEMVGENIVSIFSAEWNDEYKIFEGQNHEGNYVSLWFDRQTAEEAEEVACTVGLGDCEFHLDAVLDEIQIARDNIDAPKRVPALAVELISRAVAYHEMRHTMRHNFNMKLRTGRADDRTEYLAQWSSYDYEQDAEEYARCMLIDELDMEI